MEGKENEKDVKEIQSASLIANNSTNTFPIQIMTDVDKFHKIIHDSVNG